MCGIAGFYHPYKDYTKDRSRHEAMLTSMYQALRRRGMDEEGVWLDSYAGLTHTRLSVVDLITGRQPMTRSMEGHTWAIAYNGELYNTAELKHNLTHRGWEFKTASDTEVILTGYMEYGTEFIHQMNGIFAFAIADPIRRQLLLFRDRAGVKPLFYAVRDGEVLFASELKGLLVHPSVRPQVDHNGLCEIFGIGPARSQGCGVYKDVHEVLPGHFLTCSASGQYPTSYWELSSHPHQDSYDTTVEKTSWLIQDSIERQMVSDVPVCTFLSGGVDSSLVSAVCARELKKKNQRLTTYSFDFKGNDQWFQANDFQPSQDRPFVEQMVNFLDSDHHYLECDSLTQTDRLYDSVLAHDLPCMADVDSSLLHFCHLVRQNHKVALTGECADEIFGGYPWFHKEACFKARTFPWTMDLKARQVLLSDSFIKELNMEEYVQDAYDRSVSQTPRCPEDTPEEARRREIAWLNLKWFMQTLLNRMDRTSMYSALEARVPFADHRIIEYVWNVPWEYKTKDGMVKHLLRQSAKGLLPDQVLFRRKSPYPKTYDKGYEALLADQVRDMLHTPSSPVLPLLDPKKTKQFLQSPSDYGKPWYGQLMAGPQMLAYILQINYWLKEYHVELI